MKTKPKRKTKVKEPLPPPLPEIKKGYGYIRVSTSGQKEEGQSLESQEEQIKGWAALKKIHIIEIFKDAGISGKKTENRPGFLELMETIKNGDIIITYSLSRFSRSTIQSLQLYELFESRSIEFVCLKENFDTSTASGKLFFRIMACVAEFESDVVRERTCATMQYMKTQDRALGMYPYGWKKASKKKGSGLVEVPEEQKIIKLILDRRNDDTKNISWQAIADELNNNDIPPPRSAVKWHNNTVRRIGERGFDAKVNGKDGIIHHEPSLEDNITNKEHSEED